MRHISRLTAVVMQDQKHIQNSSNRVQRLDLIYEQLSRNYSTFDQTDDPWMTNGLSSTPFRCLVSVCLSTMTVTPRVVKACVPLFERVSSFEELLALDDEATNHHQAGSALQPQDNESEDHVPTDPSGFWWPYP